MASVGFLFSKKRNNEIILQTVEKYSRNTTVMVNLIHDLLKPTHYGAWDNLRVREGDFPRHPIRMLFKGEE